MQELLALLLVAGKAVSAELLLVAGKEISAELLLVAGKVISAELILVAIQEDSAELLHVASKAVSAELLLVAGKAVSAELLLVAGKAVSAELLLVAGKAISAELMLVAIQEDSVELLHVASKAVSAELLLVAGKAISAEADEKEASGLINVCKEDEDCTKTTPSVMLLPGGDGSASSSNILSLSSAMLGCCGPFPTLLVMFEDAGCKELDSSTIISSSSPIHSSIRSSRILDLSI